MTAFNWVSYFNIMNYFLALIEFHETPERFKPLLCLNKKTGLYLVTNFFSREYVEKQGLEVIENGKR